MKKILGKKNFFAWKILGAEKFWLEIFFFGTKNIYGLTILGPKKNSGLENNFWFEKNLENIFEQNCESKNLICKKKVKKNLGPTEIGVRIFFGSNKISGLKPLGPNNILCLEKVLSKDILVHKNYDPKKNWVRKVWSKSDQ